MSVPRTKVWHDAFLAIEHAKRPEDLFMDLEPSASLNEKLDALKSAYHGLALTVHPDHNGNSKRATETFARLNKLHEEAEQRVREGVYGTSRTTPPPPVEVAPTVITRRDCHYVIGALLGDGDLCNVYRATCVRAGKGSDIVLKIARDSRDNDLVTREAEALKKLVPVAAPDEKFYRYLPRLIESFRVPDPGHGPRQVNVFVYRDGHYTLKDVAFAYPNGICLEDAVWILNRLLEGLGYAHRQGYVHTAIVPPNVLVHPEQHAARILDWSYSTTANDAKAIAVSTNWRNLYAPEILARKKPVPASDIYMAARCISYLLGSNTEEVPLPRVDEAQGFKAAMPFKRFLEMCLVPAHLRPNDAWQVRENLDELLKRWYGPKKYHRFTMPTGA